MFFTSFGQVAEKKSVWRCGGSRATMRWICGVCDAQCDV
jgi:hypothetical protein